MKQVVVMPRRNIALREFLVCAVSSNKRHWDEPNQIRTGYVMTADLAAWPWVLAACLTGGAALFGAWWLWWRLPKRQVDQLRFVIRDPKARADVEDNFRKTMTQMFAGLVTLFAGIVALSAAVIAYLQLSQQQKASHELLISNQVSKGFEQLSSDKEVVRLGGIYALEGVMNTSEEYHRPVLEALSAFVRDGTRTETGDGPPATDIQAALTVIGRRGPMETRAPVPNLAHAHIPQANLFSANLSGANLTDADLRYANLRYANLSGANLGRTDLGRADLTDANLNHADLRGAALSGAEGGAHLERANLSYADLGVATLRGVHLRRANLSHADLSATNLTNADLMDADLRYATLNSTILNGAILERANLGRALLRANLSYIDLSDTDLTDADLSGAILTNAILTGAILSGATVSQVQLDKACGTDAKLDPGLTIKPCQN